VISVSHDLVVQLDHGDRVLRGVKAIERSGRAIERIARDQDQVSKGVSHADQQCSAGSKGAKQAVRGRLWRRTDSGVATRAGFR
jgi:hypothetical protein